MCVCVCAGVRRPSAAVAAGGQKALRPARIVFMFKIAAKRRQASGQWATSLHRAGQSEPLVVLLRMKKGGADVTQGPQ